MAAHSDTEALLWVHVRLTVKVWIDCWRPSGQNTVVFFPSDDLVGGAERWIRDPQGQSPETGGRPILLFF